MFEETAKKVVETSEAIPEKVVEESRILRLLRGLGFMRKGKTESGVSQLQAPQKVVMENGQVLLLVPAPSPEAAAAPPVKAPATSVAPAALVAEKAISEKTSASSQMPGMPENVANTDANFLANAMPGRIESLQIDTSLAPPPPAPTNVRPTSAPPGSAASGSNMLSGANPYSEQAATMQQAQPSGPVMSEEGFKLSEENPMNSFDKYLRTKFANQMDAYYPGIGNPANLLIAGLGGYGGSQLGTALAGVGTMGNARRQLANVEAQLMQIVSDPSLSSRQKRNMLKELNREAKLLGAGTASMPGTPGQAEAMSKNMSERLATKITNKRIPGMKGLGMVAGAAAPFILPDFLRRAGVI